MLHNAVGAVVFSPTLSSALSTVCSASNRNRMKSLHILWNCVFSAFGFFSLKLHCLFYFAPLSLSFSISFSSFLTLYSIVSTVCSSYCRRRRRPFMKCIQFGNLNSNKTLLVYKIILRAIVQYPVMRVCACGVCSSVFCSIPAIRIHCKQRTCHNTTNRMYATLIADINILALSPSLSLSLSLGMA